MFTFSVSTNVLNREFRKVSPAAGDCSRPLVCDSRCYFLTQKVWCHVWVNLRTISPHRTPAAPALISSLILPSRFLCSISEWQWSADSEDALNVFGLRCAVQSPHLSGEFQEWQKDECIPHRVPASFIQSDSVPLPASSIPLTSVRRRTKDNMILTPGPDWLWPGGLQDAGGILWATTEGDDSQRTICKA